MRLYEFDLVVERDMTEGADVDRLFELFGGDVTPGVSGGTPLLLCSIEAESLESAMRNTLRRLQEAGIQVLTVQIEPESLAARARCSSEHSRVGACRPDQRCRRTRCVATVVGMRILTKYSPLASIVACTSSSSGVWAARTPS